MIEVQHSTGKAGIQEFGKWKGQGNGDPLTIGGKTYPPGKLIFLGFVAPPPEDLSATPMAWKGVLRFEPGESIEACRRPFGQYVNVKRSKPYIDSAPTGTPIILEKKTDGAK